MIRHLSNSLPWVADPLWAAQFPSIVWKEDASRCRKDEFLTESTYTVLSKKLKLKTMLWLSVWGTKSKSGDKAFRVRGQKRITGPFVFPLKCWPLSFKLRPVTWNWLKQTLSKPSKYQNKSTKRKVLQVLGRLLQCLTHSLLKMFLIWRLGYLASASRVWFWLQLFHYSVFSHSEVINVL